MSWGHEVLKLYFKCPKNLISWNIRAPKYPFYNEELKLLVQTVHTYFLKQAWSVDSTRSLLNMILQRPKVLYGFGLKWELLFLMF